MSKILDELNQNKLAVVSQKNLRTDTYGELRRQVEAAFLAGRRRAQEAVESEKIRTYWEVGRLMNAHILQHAPGGAEKGRAAYGKNVVERLAKDLGTNPTTLYYSLEFARKFPISPAREKLPWSHYRALLSVQDEIQRKQLEKKARVFGWTSRELESKIAAARQTHSILREKNEKDSVARPSKLIPKRGEVDTYQILRTEVILHTGKTELLVDLGFSSFIPLPASVAKKFRDGDIVRTVPHGGGKISFEKIPKAAKADLYTYKAYVERVVDGDSIWVKIQVGFGFLTRQKLRLRALDAPEIGTRRGVLAKRFVEEELKRTPYVILTTTKPDKYDRYLSDIYYNPAWTEPRPSAALNDWYLNQLLLEKNLARRVVTS